MAVPENVSRGPIASAALAVEGASTTRETLGKLSAATDRENRGLSRNSQRRLKT